MKIEKVKIADISQDPANARKHGAKNIETIIASLRRFGQQKPIVIDSSGIVRAGNGTLEAAKLLGWDSIDAIRTELKGSEATAYAIADNRTAELAEWDDDILAATLQGLVTDDEDLLEAAGFDEDELADLLAEMEQNGDGTTGEIEEDEVPEPPVDPITQSGDLWVLRTHRVLCGDSTKAEDVARLMGTEKIDLAFTSPPYNSGNGGYKTDYNGKGVKFYNHDGDDRTEAEWVDFCGSVIKNAVDYLRSDQTPFVCNVMYTAKCRGGYGRLMFAYDHGLTVKETICWDKGAGFPSASKGILSRNWELVFVLSSGDKYTTTQGENEPRWAKWDISRQKQHEEHKATFPIGLPIRAMQDFMLGEGIVYDPFLGSGTTLIAAEQLGRKCYGMEISPAYCDVIVKRWENLTGEKAVLDGQQASLEVVH